MPVAIITGSDSGIGKAAAVRLAEDGFDIGITFSRDEEGAEDTAEKVRGLGRLAELRHLDLATAENGAAAVGGLTTRSAASTCSSTTRAQATRSPGTS